MAEGETPAKKKRKTSRGPSFWARKRASAIRQMNLYKERAGRYERLYDAAAKRSLERSRGAAARTARKRKIASNKARRRVYSPTTGKVVGYSKSASARTRRKLRQAML